VSPEMDDVEMPQEEAERIKAELKSRTTGDMRGDPLVLSARIKVEKLSFSPEQLSLTALRRIPEERISAVLGVPAVVVGLGAGLDRSTFANFSEAREAAYEHNIIPTQRMMAEELRRSLLPDFSDVKTHRVEFELGRVRILQADQDKLFERMAMAVKGGYLTINEARNATGLRRLEEGDMLMVPDKTRLIPLDELADNAAVSQDEQFQAEQARQQESSRVRAQMLGRATGRTRRKPGASSSQEGSDVPQE